MSSIEGHDGRFSFLVWEKWAQANSPWSFYRHTLPAAHPWPRKCHVTMTIDNLQVSFFSRGASRLVAYFISEWYNNDYESLKQWRNIVNETDKNWCKTHTHIFSDHQHFFFKTNTSLGWACSIRIFPTPQAFGFLVGHQQSVTSGHLPGEGSEQNFQRWYSDDVYGT